MKFRGLCAMTAERLFTTMFLLIALSIAVASSVCSADEDSTTSRRAVATVDGQQIPASEVDNEFRLAFDEAKIAEVDKPRLLRAALDQVIDRRLVLAYLTKAGQAASKADVDLELAQFEKELKAQNLTLAEHSKKVGLSPDDIRRALTWKLSWKRYCEKHLTPQNLEKYFEQHRHDFDGTQLRIAQILFKLTANADETNAAAAIERAKKLREEIAGDKDKFAGAARQQSDAPSRADGGDIGWIERHRPMPAEFSRIAFGLKPGEVSQPFVSPFGVHLITVLEEKPGTKTWKEVESELRPAVITYLFRWIADKERSVAKIEYVTTP